MGHRAIVGGSGLLHKGHLGASQLVKKLRTVVFLRVFSVIQIALIPIGGLGLPLLLLLFCSSLGTVLLEVPGLLTVPAFESGLPTAT